MSDQSEQNKSEEPTPYKLTRSRKKGIVARGMDLGFLAVLCAFAGFAWAGGTGFAGATGHLAAAALVTAPQVADGPDSLLAVTGLILAQMLRPLVFLFAMIFLFALLCELAQTGFVFSASPLKPDFSRLSPANGLKRLFTLKMLIETLKNVLKLAAYTTVAWIAVSAALRGSAAASDGRGLVEAMAASGFRLLCGFVGIALLFALLDQFVARRMFLKQMRMSRRELRREHREREGEPRIKQKRKQLHAQFAKAAEGLRAVRGSDVVITNPTHLAVALRYDQETMAAPIVTAKGAQSLAGRIRSLAFTYGVTTIEDKPLAQDLYRRCATGSPIPEDHYRRVADIYRQLRAVRAGQGNAHA